MENAPFTGKPIAQLLYDLLLRELRKIGSFVIEVKKTSVHIVAGSSAFLGVHPQTKGLVVTIVLDRALSSKRLSKVEQVSKNRFHNELKLISKDDFNDELINWLQEAYDLKVKD